MASSASPPAISGFAAGMTGMMSGMMSGRSFLVTIGAPGGKLHISATVMMTSGKDDWIVRSSPLAPRPAPPRAPPLLAPRPFTCHA